MSTVAMEQRKKIHPHKFALWAGIASIVMMFAGLTSAYIVKRNQAGWIGFEIPKLFWYSTPVIIASSISIFFAGKAFRQREMGRYRSLMALTSLLGVLFIVLQVLGFQDLWHQGITLQSNVAHSFLYVIVGLHGIHVTGGVIAMLIVFAKAFSTRIRTYNAVPIEVVSTYWHFVDLLWIYLLIFLVMIR